MLLSFIFLFMPSADASVFGPPRPTPSQICNFSLSGDRRLRLLGEDHEDRKALAARSHLMNEAWWPVMKHLRELVLRETDARLAERARLWASTLDFSERSNPPSSKEGPEFDEIGYDGRFQGFYEQSFLTKLKHETKANLFLRYSFLERGTIYPFVSANRDFVRGIYLAASVLLSIADDHAAELERQFPPDNLEVLEKHSFSGTSLAHGLHFASKTLSQALSFVTATSIENFSAEQIGRMASRVKLGTSSLERLALGFPPTFWGGLGNRYYVKGAIALDDERNTFLTSKTLSFLCRAHAHFESSGPKATTETGLGCPVAFPSPQRGERTGVGLFLEAFWHVYDRVRD